MSELFSAPNYSPVFVYRFCSGVVNLIKHLFVSVLRARLGTTKLDQSYNFHGHSFVEEVPHDLSRLGCLGSLFKYLVTGSHMLISVI